jgi:DNA-binding response OmpR family regulator
VEVPRTGDETILLVEDEEQVRNLAERILKHLGYEVYAFDTGKNALLALSTMETRVDLLLTDVIMPEMNGRTLADLVRALRPDIKVLFASGYTDEAIVHHGVLDEGIDFIAKPYTVLGLAQRVRAVLERPPGAKSPLQPQR